MTKFIASTAIWAISILLGVGIMMYGWGLEPVSWWWIIGGGVVGRFIVEAFNLIVKEDM